MTVQILSMSGNPFLDAETALRGGRYPTLPKDARITVPPTSATLDPGNWVAFARVNEDFDKLGPNAPTPRTRHLLPTLPDQKEPWTPLMTWWFLLFGLSISARYHPSLWIQTLDVDTAPQAVPLQSLLDQALAAVPKLVHDTLLLP
jgi:hypothetical protein